MGGEGTASMCAIKVPRSDDMLGGLHDVLEQARWEEQAGRRRRAVALASLCLLLLAAGSGLALAILGFLRPAHKQSAPLARRLVLAASAMSLLYIGVHVRGARRNRLRPPGAPHLFGEYTLASALIVSRLAIGVWVAALVATILVLASTPTPFAAGVAGATSPPLSLDILSPLLHLVVCLVAMPSFFVIAATIERHQAPFATAGLSPARPLLRTFRGDESADGLDEHVSISRRMSMQRAVAPRESAESLEKPLAGHAGRPRGLSQSGPGLRPLELVAADTRVDDDAKTELMANSPVRAAYRTRPRTSLSIPPAPLPYSVPPVPPLPPLSKLQPLSQLNKSSGTWPRTRGPGHSTITPENKTVMLRHAGLSRGSSLDTAPPFSEARGQVPVLPSTSTVPSTQPLRPSAARHVKRTSHARRSRSSTLMEPQFNGSRQGVTALSSAPAS